MKKLFHCGSYQKAKVYYLKARNEHLQQDVLLVAQCPSHQDIPVMAWYGVDWQGQKTVLHRITYRQQAAWLLRIQTDCLSQGVIPYPIISETPSSVVSDYTRFISQPVDRIYERLLRRQRFSKRPFS